MIISKDLKVIMIKKDILDIFRIKGDIRREPTMNLATQVHTTKVKLGKKKLG